MDHKLEIRLAGRAAAGLPRFGFDVEQEVENWAVIVAGRFVEEPPTQGAVKKLEAFVRAAAEKTKLPLAYVHTGTTINWVDEDDDVQGYESAPALIGLVIAHASSQAPVKIARKDLDASRLEAIPESFWTTLAEEHGVTMRDPGLYLAPAGWTVASLYDGAAKYDDGGRHFVDAETLATTCAEDTSPGKRLEDRDLPDTLWLYATYA